MVAPYTAVDLIRVMDHEMHHRHEEAARRRSWLRRGPDRPDGDQPKAGSEAGPKRAGRAQVSSFLSLFSKPTA